MSLDRPLPPCAEVCLVRRRSSTQKGGTIIAEDVHDWATHARRICDPDGYRPPFCPGCRGTHLHVHDYRERVVRGEPEHSAVTTVRHECVTCDAIWQVLPGFVARCLWRTWEVVARCVALTTAGGDADPPRPPKVPSRTVRRWRARWHRPATYLAQVLAASGEAAWAALACVMPPRGTCAQLVGVYVQREHGRGKSLAAFAALVDRLQPHVRLM